MTTILFLFGAGASKGSEEKGIIVPALATELFKELKNSAPSTWGTLYSEYGDHLQLDFEKRMDIILDNCPEQISELQRDMARYFFRFSPSPNNLYIQLIKRLGIENISFASLNYDRLLEEAILRSEFFPNYKLEKDNAKEVNLCLLHGCCNLFLTGLDIPPGALHFTYGENVFDSSEIKIVRSSLEFQTELRSRALPPIMACFNQKKTSAVGKMFLEAQKVRFEQMVRSAELIVVVGVQVMEHDNHIWSPLEKTDAKIVYCSGSGDESFKSWAKKFRRGKNDECLPGYFLDNFGNLCKTAEESLANYRSYSQNKNYIIV